MGWFIVILFILAMIFLPRIPIKRCVEKHAEDLHDYVIGKATRRGGLEHKDAQKIADDYMEDFLNECQRKVPKWGSYFPVRNKIIIVKNDFLAEIDARLR